ncbi:MAG: hypothetical protein M9962_04280 [Oligoflexia bacterium]|nr:hypothetical protein [Oligoflexia bacterium]
MRALWIFLFCFCLLIATSFSAFAENIYWENSQTFWIQEDSNKQIVFEKYQIDKFGYQHLVEKVYKTNKKKFSFLLNTPKKKVSEHINLKDIPLPPSIQNQRIWRAIYSWDEDWEKKYSQWIRTEVSKNFFEKHQISTDCADVPIALRWIFSRMNGLPAGFHLKGTLRLFTHESFLPGWEWLSPNRNWWEDERFLASLDYILQNTYTHSLMHDLYPIAINRNTFDEGTVFLNLYSNTTGHTELVSLVNADEPQPIRILASDVPRKIRELSDYGLQDWGIFPEREKSGFLKFLWLEKKFFSWTNKAATSMPNYSLEQYDSKFYRSYVNLPEAIIGHVFPDWKPDFAKLMKSKTQDLMLRLTNRVSIVEDGYTYCQSINGCKEGSSAYETWSTPSRDAAIKRINDSILRLYYSPECIASCKKELDSLLNIAITRINNKNYYFRKAILIWRDQKYTSDPNDNISIRWGIED